MTELNFDGILFSKTTEIFYKVKNKKLYKFCVYGNGVKQWQTSEYQDDSKHSKNWKKATEPQIEAYPDLKNL